MSSVTGHELRFGVERMPAGRRRDSLRGFLVDIASRLRTLPYDRAAADWHAEQRARLVGSGRTPPYACGKIAATAATNRLRLVTRNVSDFRDFAGLTVESWWE